MVLLTHTPTWLEFVSGWFDDQETSDVEVRLNNKQTLHCHRVVLRSWSTVWTAALTDKKECALDMTTHDAATVEMCLRYCYTSSIDLTDENLTQVHLFAYQYNLEDLKSACEKVITEEVSATNCMSLYCYLLKHDFPSLPNALTSVTAFVCNEFVSAAKSDGFLRVDEEALCRMLGGSLLATEDDVLDACNRWLGASKAQASERVLKLIRFPMLSANKLIELRSYPWFQPDLEARYDFAMRWVLTQLVADSDLQEPLRIRLAEENKLDDHLSPRVPLIEIESEILDMDMKRTLATMIGSGRAGRLLVNSKSGANSEVFDKAVAGQGPFVCIIKSKSGHVFGAYVEDTFGGEEKWIDGSPNNFLFSLKNIPPQKVVKLKRSGEGSGIYVSKGYGLNIGGLRAFNSHKTGDSDAFELAPGYESVGEKTLHGKLGDYTPEFMEVFALSKLI